MCSCCPAFPAHDIMPACFSSTPPSSVPLCFPSVVFRWQALRLAGVSRCRSHRRKNILRGLFGSVCWLFQLSATLCHNSLTPGRESSAVPRRLLADSLQALLLQDCVHRYLGSGSSRRHTQRSHAARLRRPDRAFFFCYGVHTRKHAMKHARLLTWQLIWELP